MSVTRYKEIPNDRYSIFRAVSLNEAKAATRVADTFSVLAHASATVGVGGPQLTLVSLLGGTVGNQYVLEVIIDGNDTPLSVEVDGNYIIVNLATDSSGIAISTVSEISSALAASNDVTAIVSIQTQGSGVLSLGDETDVSIQFSGGVNSGDEDAYIGLLIDAATLLVEKRTGRALVRRKFRAFYDEWPCDDVIELPLYPVFVDEEDEDSLAATLPVVKYYDYSTGQLTTLDTSMYDLDTEDEDLPARICRKDLVVWPTVANRPNTVRVDFYAGYGQVDDDGDLISAVPANIKQCILFLVAHWYANREPVINGTATLSNKVPYTFETVLNSFRLVTVA